MKLLEYIKSKPSDAKAQYAALVAGIVTGAIAVIWISTLPARFALIGAPSTDTEGGLAELGEIIGDTREQLGNVVGANQVTETNVTTNNLDLLGTGESPDSGTERAIGNLFIQETEGGAPAEDTPTSTGERKMPTPSTKIVPRTILIGTSTSGNAE